jgi:hypothetical protein
MSSSLQVKDVEDGSVIELPSPIEIVKDEARLQGFEINDAVADYVLWEETGWPTFWSIGKAHDPKETVELSLRKQARKFFESPAWRRT